MLPVILGVICITLFVLYTVGVTWPRFNTLGAGLAVLALALLFMK